jgi:CHASE2 domain-containing sensor protein
MTPECHARIQEIFQRAIDLPLQSRIEYLDQACDGDADLRARIDLLIEASEETQTMYEPVDREDSIRECPECGECFPLGIAVCPVDGTTLQFNLPGSGIIDRKYRIQRRLGQGGMGAVYLAKHLGLGKQFALKLIRAGGSIPQSYRERFETEARALGRVKHPHIVDVTDYGVDPREGSLPYLVMEYLEGKPLDVLLRERRYLPFPEAARLLRMVASAIDAAHAENIIHGDLKPANLLVTGEIAAGVTVKVVDFGLARLLPPEVTGPPAGILTGDRTTRDAGIRGTPAYMAPELFRRGEASQASDRYALGALAYELLTGSPPFGRNLGEVIQNQNRPIKLPSVLSQQVPAELDAPLLGMLNDAPEQRPANAIAAVLAMETAWLKAEQRQWRQSEFPRRWLVAATCAAFAIAFATIVSWTRFGRMLENSVADARIAILPGEPPSPRVMVVALDDASINQDSRLLGERSVDFAHMIETIFAAGAKAVAIDVLPPESWSRSPEFASSVMSHADHLTLAKLSKSGAVIGPECISSLTASAIGGERFQALFGFVNLKEDQDGKIRRTPAIYQDLEGREEPSFALQAVWAMSMHLPKLPPPAGQPVWIDYGEGLSAVPEISWKDVPERLQTAPDLFRDKLVMVGADFAGSNDDHHIPDSASRSPVSGLRIQALIANTILKGFPIRDAGLGPSLFGIGVACLGILALRVRFPHQPMAGLMLAMGCFCGYAIFCFAIFRESRLMVPVIAPELSIVLSALIGRCLQLKAYPLGQRG